MSGGWKELMISVCLFHNIPFLLLYLHTIYTVNNM